MFSYEIKPDAKIFLNDILIFLKTNKFHFLKFRCQNCKNISRYEILKLFLHFFNEPINMSEFMEIQIKCMQHDLGIDLCNPYHRTEKISQWIKENAISFRIQFIQKQVVLLDLIDKNLINKIYLMLDD